MKDSKRSPIHIEVAQVAEQSDTLSQLIESIVAAAYYDIDMLFNRALSGLKAYLKKRPLGLIEWGEHLVLVDPEALLKKVNLNCEACTSQHDFGCCCGPPCDYSQRNLKVFREHESALIKELIAIEPLYYGDLLVKQVQNMSTEALEAEPLKLELVSEKGQVGWCKGRCNLLVRKDGMARCLTHHYALKKGLSIYELSPLSCLMFPLEFLVFLTEEGRSILYVTSVIDAGFAKAYGRWGAYRGLDVPFRCVDPTAHNEAFKEADYLPLYQVSEGLLVHEFGEAVYKGIKQICSQISSRQA